MNIRGDRNKKKVIKPLKNIFIQSYHYFYITYSMSKLESCGLKQYLPKPYTRKRYYTPADVSLHNTANDLWVSFFGKVWDLTKLV